MKDWLGNEVKKGSFVIWERRKSPGLSRHSLGKVVGLFESTDRVSVEWIETQNGNPKGVSTVGIANVTVYYPKQEFRLREGDQPLPEESGFPPVHQQIIDGLLAAGESEEGRIVQTFRAREGLGLKRYGKRLRPFNGRNFLLDLEEELADGAAYAWGAKEERFPTLDIFHRLIGCLRDLTQIREEWKR